MFKEIIVPNIFFDIQNTICGIWRRVASKCHGSDPTYWFQIPIAKQPQTYGLKTTFLDCRVLWVQNLGWTKLGPSEHPDRAFQEKMWSCKDCAQKKAQSYSHCTLLGQKVRDQMSLCIPKILLLPQENRVWVAGFTLSFLHMFEEGFARTWMTLHTCVGQYWIWKVVGSLFSVPL